MARKYFGTDGIRGRTGISPITPEFALKLGWAVGQILIEEGRGTVIIGKDTRISGYMLVAALEAGLLASGLDVHLMGPLPTPAIAYLTRSLGAKLGIVVSASHNPYYDNGIKFFNQHGHKLCDNIESKIETLIDAPMSMVDPSRVGRAKMLNDAPSRYIEFCKNTLTPHVLQGLKIVLDCANGANYHVAQPVFAELGAQIITTHCEPNGFNINEKCGSTHPQSLQQAVLEHQADLGIAFDGDGDRVIFVDNQGQLVDGDDLLFILAKAYQQSGRLEGGIVGTHMSNLGLEQALHTLNIPFLRTNIGDRYVMEALIKNGWQLGGETSGHIICLDKTTSGDGIICALQIVEYMQITGKSLQELKSDLKKCDQILVNIPLSSIATGRQIMAKPEIQTLLEEAKNQLANQGRVLLRPSGTEALIRVMVEGENKALIQQVANFIATRIELIAA